MQIMYALVVLLVWLIQMVVAGGALCFIFWISWKALALLNAQTEPLTPTTTAGALAARLGMQVVEGDPAFDLTIESDHRVRIEGSRAGRRVTIRHSLTDAGTHVLRETQLTVPVRSDVRLEIVARADRSFRLLDDALRIHVGDARIDGPLDVRASAPHGAQTIAEEIVALAAIPMAHVVIDKGSITFFEGRGTAALSLHGELVLSIVERMADRLEAHDTSLRPPIERPHTRGVC